MGVTGVGKTTVGQALAAELHWRFIDADDFHSAVNVAKMHAGIPLGDEDRAPWLLSLHDAIVEWTDRGEDVVLACSALKESYRRLLVVNSEVHCVFLHADFEIISQRLIQRSAHYMNPTLLRSQFDTLEKPRDAVVIDAGQTVPQIVSEIRRALGI